MHYYKRNLGDYAKKAGRLSMLQHGSYTLLIDACYDRERFPTMAEAIEWTWASSTTEIDAVEFVLRKFFILDGDVYVQHRIQEEIAEYHSKAETNKRIATERETKRRQNSTNRERYVNEAPPNHEPETINQEPVIKKKSASLESPEGVPQSIWADFLKLRAAKKAPLTATALRGIQREADKAKITLSDALAVSCEAGWQGFRADWYAARTNGKTGKVQAESFAAQDLRAKREAWEAMTNRKWPDQDLPSQGRFDVIEAEVTTIRGIS